MRNNWIDSLKGIAILGIVLVHSRLNGSYGYFSSFTVSGARGVQLMFLINGYLIFASLDRADENQMKLRDWYIGKFKRLVPMYWFFTFIHLAVFGLGERFYLGPLEKVSVLNILCNLFFLHGFNPYYIGSINANWYMADLAIWYLIAPFIFKFLKSFKKMLTALFVFIPLDYVVLIILDKVPLIESEPIWHDYINVLCFPAEFPIILLGGALYLGIRNVGRTEIISGRKKLACAGTFFSLVCLMLLMIGSDRMFVFTNEFSYGIAFAILFAAQSIYSFPVFNNRFFALLGKYSYGIYLSHIIVIELIYRIYAFLQMPDITFFGWLFTYCLALTVSLGISVLMEQCGNIIRKAGCTVKRRHTF